MSQTTSVAAAEDSTTASEQSSSGPQTESVASDKFTVEGSTTDIMTTSTVAPMFATGDRVVFSGWLELELKPQGYITYTANGHDESEIWVATSSEGNTAQLLRYNRFPNITKSVEDVTNDRGKSEKTTGTTSDDIDSLFSRQLKLKIIINISYNFVHFQGEFL